MFERFTESARRVLFFARHEASLKGARAIDTEHLLAGLLREGTGLVPRLLRESSVPPDTLRQEVDRLASSGETIPPSVEIPFSDAAKAVMQYTAEEADRLGHGYIGPEH